MGKPIPKQFFSLRINEFTLSIEMLLDAGHKQSALIVLYTAIDIFASLCRLETENDTTGNYFKKWANDYIIAGSQLSFTSQDLWGARCGLLHTHTAASKVSREGTAREIHYYRGTPSAELKQRMELLAAQGKLFVNIDDLYARFVKGLDQFLTDIQRDSELEKRVLRHSAKLFASWCSDGYADQHQ